ncbi:MAG: flippase [Rikenella sp.]|nr:flippase [Rikenella sp.]
MSATKNVIYNILINVLNVAVPIVTVPYVSRVFGVENIGVVNFALTYASYFTLFIYLGIPIYGTREIGKLRNAPIQRDYVVSELFNIMLVSSLIFTAGYVVSIAVVPTLRQEWPFLMAAGVGLLFSSFNVDWYYTGRENLKISAVRNLIVKAVGLMILFVWIRTPNDLLLYLVLNALTNGLAQVWTFVYMLRHDVRLRWRRLKIKRHLKPVIVLSLSSLAISIYTMLDVLMLGFLSTYTEVGYYSSAIKISRLLLPVVTASAMVAIPRIAHLYKENDISELRRVTDKSFSFMSLLAPPITIGLVVISSPFVPFFFGAEFVGAVPSMMIVSLLVILIGINNFYGPQILVPTDNEKWFLYAVLFGTGSNFLLNLFFIPRWGAVGASWASVVAETIVTGMVMWFAYRLVPQIRPNYRPLIQSIIASLPMFLYGYLFIQWSDSPIGSLTGITICSAMTFILLELIVFRDPMAMEIRDKLYTKLHLR